MIYMDNAATTKISNAARTAMIPYMKDKYFNIQGNYNGARRINDEIEGVREKLAKTINAKSSEIYFNSGGTEGDNHVMYMAGNNPKNIVIVGQTEHNAVLNSALKLKEKGLKIYKAKVDHNGVTDIDKLEQIIYNQAALIGDALIYVSIMTANNETGVIQPIEEIGKIVSKYNNVIFHTDAVQAYGHIPIDVKKLNVDMLTVSAHKFGGPKGVGFIYIRDGIKAKPMIVGGGQEHKMRSGTVNTLGVIGMGAAAIDEHRNMSDRSNYEKWLRNIFINRLLETIPDIYVNGELENRLPGNINVSIKGIDSNELLSFLDNYNICISRASACSNIGGKVSHVLEAMGVEPQLIRGTIRITINYNNSVSEVMYVCEMIREGVERLRKIGS